MGITVFLGNKNILIDSIYAISSPVNNYFFKKNNKKEKSGISTLELNLICTKSIISHIRVFVFTYQISD